MKRCRVRGYTVATRFNGPSLQFYRAKFAHGPISESHESRSFSKVRGAIWKFGFLRKKNSPRVDLRFSWNFWEFLIFVFRVFNRFKGSMALRAMDSV